MSSASPVTDRPLRILLVARVFWPNIGGIERHVQWLAEHLVRRGHTCDVVTLNRSFEDGSAYPPYDHLDVPGTPGVHVWRVPFAGSTRYPIAPRAAPLGSTRQASSSCPSAAVSFVHSPLLTSPPSRPSRRRHAP